MTLGDSYDEENALGEPLGIDARSIPNGSPAQVATPAVNTPPAATIPSLPDLDEVTTSPFEVDNVQSGGSNDPSITLPDPGVAANNPVNTLPGVAVNNPVNTLPDVAVNNPANTIPGVAVNNPANTIPGVTVNNVNNPENTLPGVAVNNPVNTLPDVAANNPVNSIPSTAASNPGTSLPELEVEDYETEIADVEDTFINLPTENANPRDTKPSGPILNVFTEQKAPSAEAPQSFYGAPIGGLEEDYENDVFADILPLAPPQPPTRKPFNAQRQPGGQNSVSTQGQTGPLGQPSSQVPSIQGQPPRPFTPQRGPIQQGPSATGVQPGRQRPVQAQGEPSRQPGQRPLLPPVDVPSRGQPSPPQV